jgi:aryl carrier-like protein
MAAAQTARQQERAARWGVQSMAPTDALAVMHELLRGAPPQIGVLSMDWTRMLSQFPAGAEPPRLAVLAEPVGARPQGPAADARPLPERLRTAPGRDPAEVVAEFVGERVGAVLGLPPTQLDTATPLVNLGLDSLMAVELKNRVERDGAPAVPLARYLDGSDIAGLAVTLLAAIDGAAGVATSGGDGLDPTELLARLHEMSEAEMDTLLARMANGGDDR